MKKEINSKHGGKKTIASNGMDKYFPTIGLEIHAELLTKTKMFCDSKNDTEEKRPNVNICPICMGHPGTLPVINREAVRQVLRLGAAVGGKLADYAEFDRKNYFYPDIPKGYQISQYKHPLVSGGEIIGIRLTRVHLEEDTAKSFHPEGQANGAGERGSLIDFNRAGIPLMELVTEPVIHDAITASKFAKELRLLLRYLDASNANMEKGEMRVEANISVSKTKRKFGTKVEVKNLNSFKSVEKAIQYEIERQVSVLGRGEKIIQETRGWDENTETTYSQRVKEESHDYRYFPDPDLPKLKISEVGEFEEKKLRETLPELPWDKRERYVAKHGLPKDVAEVYATDFERSQSIDSVIKLTSKKEEIKIASNYILVDLGVTKVSATNILKTVRMINDGLISSTSAKIILKDLENSDGEPKTIAEDRNLIQRSNRDELNLVAKRIIAENEKAVTEYKLGKISSLQFLIGQAMKISGGGVNPKILKEIFESKLKQ